MPIRRFPLQCTLTTLAPEEVCTASHGTAPWLERPLVTSTTASASVGRLVGSNSSPQELQNVSSRSATGRVSRRRRGSVPPTGVARPG